MSVVARTAPLRLLLVEDDDADFLLVSRLIGRIAEMPMVIERASGFDEALAAIRNRRHDLYLLDYYLGVYTGLDLLRELEAGGGHAPVIFLTGTDDRSVDVAAMKAGAEDYLVKDQITPQMLERSIRYSLERHRLVKELRALSLRDELTGLYNRRAFFTLAEQQLRLARRFGHPLSVLYADIDGLKTINDTQGHEEGDRAIVAMANVLRRTFRDSDVVARLGGDEFVVLVAQSSADTLAAARGRLRANLEAFNAGRPPPRHLSVSLGGATLAPEEATTLDQLLRAADVELYAEKRRRHAARRVAGGGEP